ncbi:unnamed protein product [Arabidopsis lyrata]|nr:unnamed protein product [Arabidopsis lyrata]
MGAFRESNSGPLAPKARIIPLDQMPGYWCFKFKTLSLFTDSQLEALGSSYFNQRENFTTRYMPLLYRSLKRFQFVAWPVLDSQIH